MGDGIEIYRLAAVDLPHRIAGAVMSSFLWQVHRPANEKA